MTPFEQGKQAARHMVSEMDNPYPKWTHDYDRWQEGWKAGQYGAVPRRPR